MRFQKLLLSVLLSTSFGLSAGIASAAGVKLRGASASTSGETKLKIEDFGTCAGGLRLRIGFSEAGKKVAVSDQFGRTFTGGYRQSGKDRRKVEFRLDRKSRKAMRQAMEDEVRRCTGARAVEADIDELTLLGAINKSRDAIKVKGRIEGDGRADGEKGKATYTFKTIGTLTLPPR